MRNAPNHEATQASELDSDQQDSAQVAALAASQVHPDSALPSRPSESQSVPNSAHMAVDHQCEKATATNAGNLSAFSPSDQQYLEWCERHDLPDHLSRDAFDDAVSLYLTGTNIAAAPNTAGLAHGHRDDYYLMANCRALLSTRRTKMPNWSLAAELFATGSNSARKICYDAGIDPDGYRVERACKTADKGAARAASTQG